MVVLHISACRAVAERRLELGILRPKVVHFYITHWGVSSRKSTEDEISGGQMESREGFWWRRLRLGLHLGRMRTKRTHQVR